MPWLEDIEAAVRGEFEACEPPPEQRAFDFAQQLSLRIAADFTYEQAAELAHLPPLTQARAAGKSWKQIALDFDIKTAGGAHQRWKVTERPTLSDGDFWLVKALEPHRLGVRVAGKGARARRGYRRPGEENGDIACACGCGRMTRTFNREGRRRTYILGHQIDPAELAKKRWAHKSTTLAERIEARRAARLTGEWIAHREGNR